MEQTRKFKTGFFRNLIFCFMPSFYREAPRQPLTNAFIHLAGLSAILAAIITGLIYYNYTGIILPAYMDFYNKGLPDNLFFENGKIEYTGENPHKYSAELSGNKFGIIVDTDNSDNNIPEYFTEALLVTKDKIYFGNSKNSHEVAIPSERISAKEFITGLFKPNTTRVVIEGAQSFTILFASAFFLTAVFAGIFFLSISRKDKSVKFGNQLGIAFYASTPLFAGAIAIQGISQQSLIMVVMGISFFLFVCLLLFGTLEFLRYSSLLPEKENVAQ